MHVHVQLSLGLNNNPTVATHFEKITHFEQKFQSVFNLGPNQQTLKIFSKCVKLGTNLTHFENFFQSALRLYINITFDVNFLRTLKKIYTK